MSVKVLSKVWEGYPGGGSELLVLLALADWSDDAGKCWPAIASIGRKSRLSPDQARRVTHRLIDAGFLQVTEGKDGGGSSRRYKIQLDKLTPCVDATPCAHARGGADATPPLAPMQGDPLHSYASRTVIDTPLTTKKASSRKKSKITLKQFLEACRENSEQAIPEKDPIFEYAKTVGLDVEMIAICWQEFKAAYLQADSKSQKDWRQHFRNAVRRNWYKLWFLKEGEVAQWTSVGEQARRASA